MREYFLKNNRTNLGLLFFSPLLSFQLYYTILTLKFRFSIHFYVCRTIVSSGGLNKGVTANGGMHIRRGSPLPTSVTRLAAATRQVSASVIGVREMLTSLGLLCLLSLMMALLGLIFLLKMSPPPDAIHFIDQVRIVSPDEAHSVYEVSLALCSLAMTLDVCCCLVCATQLLFAARLITASTCSSSNSSRDRLVTIKVVSSVLFFNFYKHLFLLAPFFYLLNIIKLF